LREISYPSRYKVIFPAKFSLLRQCDPLYLLAIFVPLPLSIYRAYFL